jgi:hypothetical protein
MYRRPIAIVATGGLVACAYAGATATAASLTAPDPRQTQAEHNIIEFLQQEHGHRWILRHRGGRRLYPRLYNPRTRLLRDNTQVRCRRSRNPRSPGRFFCLVRPGRHRRHEGLHIRYVHYQPGDYFKIWWVFYRRGHGT